MLGGIALKAARYVGISVKVLDIEQQPLRSIGLVSSFGVTVVFLMFLVISLLSFPTTAAS